MPLRRVVRTPEWSPGRSRIVKCPKPKAHLLLRQFLFLWKRCTLPLVQQVRPVWGSSESLIAMGGRSDSDVADQDMISAQSLICGIRKGPASWFGNKPAEWRYVNRNGIRSTVIGFGSTWTAFDAFNTNSKRVPKDQEDAEDCEFAAADHMFEQLDAAVKRPSAIQYSGPNIRITII